MPESSCLCGQNRISYPGSPILNFRCHCTDERKLTGAAFALNILWSSTALQVLSGTLSTYTKKALSGNNITNHSCSTCGSLLYRTSDGYPGTMVIKAGCMDGGDAAMSYVPQIEIFTRSRVPWVSAVEGAKQEVADFTSFDL